MNLDELDVVEASDKGAPLTLRHPATGEAGDAVIHVLGYDSQTVLDARRVFDKAILASGKRDVDLQKVIADRNIAMARAAIVSVTSLTLGGKEVGVDQLRELLARPGLSWIVDQITAFGGDRANFFPKPPLI